MSDNRGWKPMKKDVVDRWCFSNEHEDDVTVQLLKDGSVTVRDGANREVTIPHPVVELLVESYSLLCRRGG